MAASPDGSKRAESEPKERRDPLVGTVINGKFKVEKAIARGGMGRIYFGRQAPLDRPVALKIVKADGYAEEDSKFLKRFLLEASILAKLQHPNVVTLFDYGRIEGAPVEMYFIAMEFLDGETLTERLRDRGALAAHEALVLLRQIARGLREAHGQGAIHRDLKPSNIVIVPEADGEIVKLVDFGIGKVESPDVTEDLTREGLLVGTPRYMAPEQFDGQSSPASDVYALGTIIYQCLAGQLPFAGSNLADFMVAKLRHPIPPLREVNPTTDASETLEQLVYGMLARRPEDRPSLEEVFSQLAICEEEVFGTSGARLGAPGSRPGLGFPVSSRPHSIGALKVPYTIVAPAPVVSGMTPSAMTAPTSAPPRRGNRARTLAAAALVVLGVLVIGGGVWLGASAPPDKPPITSAAAPSASAETPAAPASGGPFTVHIHSMPPGAAVSEKGVVLGVTPLDVRIERESVAAGPRIFELRKDGHLPATFTQGPATADVDHDVSLAPATSAARPAARPATGPKPPPREPTGEGIRLTR